MDRREFIKTIGLGAIHLGGLTMTGCASGTQRLSGNTQVQKRPNIIFLMSDDQRWDLMGCMGNPVIKTPNMDRLAAEGVLFENAFLTTSICMASRASVMLGQFESRHQCNFERPSNKTISYAEFETRNRRFFNE